MWQRLRDWARSLRREAHALYFAARHPRTPWYVKAVVLVIAAYALSPIDLIPDFIPVLGLIDEALLLPLAIAWAVKHIPADVMTESRARAAAAAERPRSWIAAFVIGSVWIVVIAAAIRVVYRWYAVG